MRLLFLVLLGLLITFPMVCFLNPFKSTPDEERFKYSASGKEVKGRSGGSERPDEALRAGPESPEEALITRPEVIVEETTAIQERDIDVLEEEVVVLEGAPLFTVIYYARGPELQAKGSSSCLGRIWYNLTSYFISKEPLSTTRKENIQSPPPYLVGGIISSSSTYRDRVYKKKLYAKYGVRKGILDSGPVGKRT